MADREHPGERVKTLRALGALVLLTPLLHCFAYEDVQNARQLRTYADMQEIVSRIETTRRGEAGVLSRDDVLRMIRSVQGGQDAWGNEYYFDVRAEGEGDSYILVSFGSDGVGDYDSTSLYFDLQEESVAGQHARDILFRDGLPILNGGK